jgi:hypothetical protein
MLLFITFKVTVAQTETTPISLSFENAKKIAVLQSIEALTVYDFYLVEEWLDDKPISGNFKDVSINEILDTIFKETVINYYVSPDNKIILTRNNLIYDNLPEGFFGATKTIRVQENTSEPVFITEQASKNTKIETVRIGKENKNIKQRRFTLSGYAKNAITDEPIVNMAILIKGKNISAVTDIDGYYEIALPPGVNLLETSSLGIENAKKRVVIYSNGNLDFELTESSEILDEVVLRANRDRNVKEAITGVTQIEVEEIKNIPLVLGERDILKVATTLPGIKSAGEGASGFNVRGGKADQNLILLDNAVIYNPAHFFGIFSALNPFTSGDVNIYKGSIPAEYGGRLSSVFDINTKDATTEKLSGEVSVGPVTSNITLETPVVKDKSGLIVGARGTYSDWILKSLDDDSLNNSKASFYDLVAKYNHKINENNNLETTGYYSRDAFSITSDSLFNYSNRLLSLKWDHSFNDKNKGSIILANSQYKFGIEFDGTSDDNFDLGYTVNETHLKLKMKYLLNKKHKFDYGISSKLYIVDPGNIDPLGSNSIVESLAIPRERGLESAIFIADNFTVNKKLLINAGLRYSFYAALGAGSQRIYEDGQPKNEGTLINTQDFGKNDIIETYGGPEVRLSARYFITPSFSVKGSYGNTYQYIHTLSNNTTVSPTDTWKLSDVNIKPQQARQYALGFYKNLDGNTYEMSVEGYYKSTKNILDYKVGAELLLNETIEQEVLQGDGRSYGVEFLLKKTKGKLNGWLGYSYSRSLIKLDSEFAEERVNGGSYFPANFDKPHDLSIVANYKLTKRFSLSANFTYQTGRPVTYPIGSYVFNGSEQVFYSDRNQFRIPDYYRMDIGLNIEGNHKIKKFAHSFWNISIYNVLGRNNPYSVFFVTDNGEIKAYQSSIFSIPVPTITYNFKF